MEKEKKDTKNIMRKKKDFIWNALEGGWTIKKKEDSYIFLKDHEGKKEVFTESYLRAFIVQNLNGDKKLL
jgi:hypothetical protein